MNDLISLKKVEKIIKESSATPEEKEELWKIVDEIVHHKVVGCILDSLDKKHHQEFLDRFTKSKLNQEIINFLEEKAGKEISSKIKKTIKDLEIEILREIK